MPGRESDACATLDAGRWSRLMHGLGFAPNAQTLQALVAAHGERHRHYHTASHIAACLRLLDAHVALAERPHELELALWFHDAVYRPLAQDNEQQSADWVARFLTGNHAPREVTERVRDLVLATVHAAPPASRDEALLLDIDLSILGADAKTYDAYETAIRQEYHMVPMMIYGAKRAEVLEGFLQRPAIYLTAPFRIAREAQARSNLARAILRLAR